MTLPIPISNIDLYMNYLNGNGNLEDLPQINEYSSRVDRYLFNLCVNRYAVETQIQDIAYVGSSSKIIAFGDSNTYGRNGIQIPYPTWLSWLLGSEVINKGVGGNKSSDLLARIQADVIALKPKYCILMIGTNDIGGTVPLATIQANVLSLINTLTINNITPIVCGVIPRRDGTFAQNNIQLNRWYERICRENGYMYIDTYSPFMSSTGISLTALYEDNLHLMSKGYLTLANTIFSKINFLKNNTNGYCFGETQGISNPIFATNTTGWATYLSAGVVCTVTRVVHPTRGYWAQFNKSLGGDANSMVVYYTDITTQFAVGKYTDISFDLDTDLDIGTGSILVNAVAMNGGTELTTTTITDKYVNNPVSNIRVFGSVLTPVNTTKITLKVYIYGGDAGVIRIGNFVARLRD